MRSGKAFALRPCENTYMYKLLFASRGHFPNMAHPVRDSPTAWQTQVLEGHQGGHVNGNSV